MSDESRDRETIWKDEPSTIRKRMDVHCTHLDMAGDSCILDSPIVSNLSYCAICGETWTRS